MNTIIILSIAPPTLKNNRQDVEYAIAIHEKNCKIGMAAVRGRDSCRKSEGTSLPDIQESRELYIDETERKPNRYAVGVLVGIVLLISVVCLLNELGIFELKERLVRVSLAVTAIQLALIEFIVRKERWIVCPSVKYIIMAMMLLLVLTLTVLLNINAVLAYVLPLLLATQYRSRGVSLLALTGACVCCLTAPILSYLLDTWSLVFLTGYIETFCRVTIDVTPGNAMSALDAIKQITLYWSLPQTLSLCVFGILLFSVTRSNIASVQNQIQVLDLSRSLNEQMESVLSIQERVLVSMSDIIESRDIETGGHVRRTSEVVRLLTEAMQSDPDCGVTPEYCSAVVRSAPMHDLGKIGIPDEILRKPGPLTEEEYATVRQHPQKSAEIIELSLKGIEDEELLTVAKNIALYHHERMDGQGYPERLKGKEIPLEARIMAIADVYDALVSERCYKAPMAYDEAFRVIEQAMGSQFDPELRPYLCACRDKIESFYQS